MELNTPFLAELQSLADQMTTADDVAAEVAEMNARPLTAHYFAGGKTKILVISESNRPDGEKIRVTGLRQARQIAAQYGAQPWNF